MLRKRDHNRDYILDYLSFISRKEYEIILHLAQYEHLSAIELAKIIGDSRQNISRLLSKLVDKGMVLKKRMGKRIFYELSSQGREYKPYPYKRFLMGKRAVITGSSRGIGKAIALEFAEKGADIVINYKQKKHDSLAEEVAEKAEKYGVKVVICRADISTEAGVKELHKVTISEMGGIDILVNNAGTLESPADWLHLTRKAWQKTLDTNIYGAYLTTRYFSPDMLKQRYGKIIYLASIWGTIGSANAPAYTASKSAILNLTKAMAKELAPYINVNAISPGNVDTDLTRSAGKEFIQEVIENTPLKRLGTPREIAKLAAFLVSSHASFITGAEFVIDGGFALR